MKLFQIVTVFAGLVAIAIADEKLAVTQNGLVNSLIRQLDSVAVNLNQLESVLGELSTRFNSFTRSAQPGIQEKSGALVGSVNYNTNSALKEVNTVREVVSQLTSQLAGMLRQKRSLELNEENMQQLSDLMTLLRKGRSNRLSRQSPQSIVQTGVETASATLQDLIGVASNLSNGIRRRLSNIGSSISELTAKGILSLNQMTQNAVVGATNGIANLTSSAASSVSSITSSVGGAVSNGVNQVNAIVQNTVG